MDKIITLINHKYDNPALFLLGKSWGGCIGTAYLIDRQHQERINGWIEVDGAHNLKDGIHLSWEWVKNMAQEKIDAGENEDYWRKEIDWYNSEPGTFDTKYFLRHGKNVNDLNGIYLNPSNDPGNWLPWTSPVPVLYQLNALNINNNNSFDAKNIDFTPEVHNITIPTAILWGRHDGTLPLPLGQEVYENLGTNEEDKSLFIFENSAHCPSFEEPELFAAKIKEFIVKYQ